ncbi:MAG: hypothetical protein V3S29_02675 [bacterium]
MRRRDFLKKGLWLPPAAGALLLVVLEGCRDAGCDGIDGSITNNHGHSACLTQADLTAGAEVTITLTGALHTHQVTLTAVDIATLNGGGTVATVSTLSGHTHTVTYAGTG